MLTGASVATALLMVAVGYSDRLNPQTFSWLCCAGMVFPFFVVANALFVPVWIVVRWQRLCIPVAGFVLAYWPIRLYFPISFGGNAGSDAITVVSYNVCGFGGNFRYDHAVDTVAAYLQRTGADIVCLQEDMGGKGGSGFDKMKALYAYNDTVHVQSVPGTTNAVGIHTRFPIVGKERIDYESEVNGSVAFFLLVEGDTVLVVNNHFEGTHLTDALRRGYKDVLRGQMERKEAESQIHQIVGRLTEHMKKRAPQAQTVHRYIEAHGHYPVIVCGDFNDTPISYTRHTVAQGLTDCFAAAGRGLGLSYNQKGFNLRIDHMMCSDYFEPQQCFVDSKMDASDHFPLVCRLKKVHNP